MLNPPLTPLVRSASLTHFDEVAAQCGLDGRALLLEVGLSLRCLDDPDLKIPARAVGRVLELAAERGREPAFGLRLVESRRLSNLGPLALLVRDEPTLRSVLEALVRDIHLHNEAIEVNVEQLSNLVVIRQELVTGGAQPLRQAHELAVGVTFRMLSVFLGAGWHPRLVCFSHGAPASLVVHRRLFGSAVEFGHEFNGIVCNAADLDAPNPGADPVMARYTKRLLNLAQSPQSTMTETVRRAAVLLLPRGHCRVERVAQHLGVDRRTVARRLATEGTTFSALVDGLRADLVARYIDERSRSLSEISALLGFSAPSAFSRWHRQQFGQAASTRWCASRKADRREGVE